MNTEQSLEYLKKREQELKTMAEMYEKEKNSILIPVLENRVKENQDKLKQIKESYERECAKIGKQIQEDMDILYTEKCSVCLHTVSKRLIWWCDGGNGGHYLCDRHAQKICSCDDLRCESHPCTIHERRRPPSPY
jgi:hypothetical protein